MYTQEAVLPQQLDQERKHNRGQGKVLATHREQTPNLLLLFQLQSPPSADLLGQYQTVVGKLHKRGHHSSDFLQVNFFFS
jgi:hypothetical protein